MSKVRRRSGFQPRGDRLPVTWALGPVLELDLQITEFHRKINAECPSTFPVVSGIPSRLDKCIGPVVLAMGSPRYHRENIWVLPVLFQDSIRLSHQPAELAPCRLEDYLHRR